MYHLLLSTCNLTGFMLNCICGRRDFFPQGVPWLCKTCTASFFAKIAGKNSASNAKSRRRPSPAKKFDKNLHQQKNLVYYICKREGQLLPIRQTDSPSEFLSFYVCAAAERRGLFAAGRIRHTVCVNTHKKRKEKNLMKIIQQDEKVIAYIEKDDTNERKIIESVQENGVTDFEVDSENPMLYSEDGLLYGKKKTMPNGETRLTLIAAPPDKKGTVKVAYGTEIIAGDAFADSKASKVILPETVTTITSYAFNNCENLREVVMNEGLTHIDEYAFRLCPLLDDITIPDTVLDIMANAFCESPLRNLKFQNRPQKCNNRLKIAYGAFGWCHADEIELPYRLVSLSDNNFVKVRRVVINCYDTSDIEPILNALIVRNFVPLNEASDYYDPKCNCALEVCIGGVNVYIPKIMDGYVKGKFLENISDAMQLIEKPLNEKLYDLQMYALDAAETPLDASYDAAMKVYCNTEDRAIKEKAKKILQTHSQNIIQAFYKSEDVKKLMDYLKFGLHNMKDIEVVLENDFRTDAADMNACMLQALGNSPCKQKFLL